MGGADPGGARADGGGRLRGGQYPVPGLHRRRAGDPAQRILRRARLSRVPRLDLAEVSRPFACVSVAAPRASRERAPSSSRRLAHAEVPGTDWPDTPVLLARIESEARKLGGIQHWGMNDKLDASDVARAYPRLDTWRRVRWALTKDGTLTTFDNDFTHRCGAVRSADPPSLVYDTFLAANRYGAGAGRGRDGSFSSPTSIGWRARSVFHQAMQRPAATASRSMF